MEAPVSTPVPVAPGSATAESATLRGPQLRRRRPVRPARVLLLLLMLAIAVVMIYPFYFMIDTSFKTQDQFQSGTGTHCQAGGS